MTRWERLMLEFAYGWSAEGPGRYDGLPFKPSNFETQDTETPFPYDRASGMDADTNASDNYTALAGHQRGRGRPDVSGGPPTPSSTYEKTWQDMHEAMGTPIITGPFAPHDGPSMQSARDAGPVLDADGNPVAPEYIPPNVDPKMGPNNMWGGAGTIPGQDRGFGAAPNLGNDDDPEATKWKPPEENKMNLREFFDPETPPTEEVENPEQTHEKDQTDDEVENKIDRIYGREDNDDFKGDDDGAGVVMLDDEPAGIVSLGGGEESPQGEMDGGAPVAAPQIDGAEAFQLTVEPEAGEMPTLSQMMDPQDKLVGKGGPNDVLAAQKQARSLLPQKSTWDDIAIQVGDAVINLRKSTPTPAGPPMMEKRKKGKI